MIRTRAVALPLAMIAVGIATMACATGVEPGDTQVDTGVDTVVDTGWETGIDTEPDTGADTGLDTPVDTTVDTPADTAVDTTVDTSVDTTVDTAIDTGIDTGVDTGVDTTVDTAIDTVVDTGVDTAIDTGIDTAVDTVVDTAIDTAGDDAGPIPGTCDDPFLVTGPGLYTGDTTGAPALHEPDCSGWEQPASEHVWLLSLPSATAVTIMVHPTAYWDPSLYAHHLCDVTTSTTLDYCDDSEMWGYDQQISGTFAAGDWYVFVDGYISTGTYELTFTY